MSITRRAVRQATGADGVTFILREADQCFYADEEAIGPLWKGRRFPMAACISGWVMLHRAAAVIEDIYGDPRIPADAYRPTFVRSLAMVPVRAADPIAAIGAYWARVRRASHEEVAFLQGVADAAALAIANAQLYERLDAANRAKDHILMILSHELRTPLMPILGWTRVLRVQPAGDETLAQGLAAIERNARKELALVEELLDVSQIMAGSLALDRRPLDLVAVLQATLAETLPQAHARAIREAHRFDLAAAPVLGDAARLGQALRNVLSNAIKFTSPGDTVSVSLSADGEMYRVDVADTGIGLEPATLCTVFEPFRQADGGTSRSHAGLGLGLAITRHVIELHGGRVSAESRGEGTGATFSVWLPAADGGTFARPLAARPGFGVSG